jgi:hypothetical protein
MEGFEKTNTESTRSCCNCTIVEGEKPHPESYLGCSHEKGKKQRRTAQRTPKGFSGRVLFSQFTLLEQSNAAALHEDTEQQQTDERREQQELPQHKFQKQIC